jgi:hypothetical protein
MTSTYNPILGERKVSPFGFFRRPFPARAGTALVLYRSGQPLTVVWPSQRVPRQIWRSAKVYLVDISEHTLEFTVELPARSDLQTFDARVWLTSRVVDPEKVVLNNVTDVLAVCEPMIIGRIRQISRRYGINEASAAEEAIQNELTEFSLANHGLEISRSIVILSVGKETSSYLEHRRSFQFEQERVQDSLRAERERVQREISFYAPLVEGGIGSLLALQLAQHPEDVPRVIEMLRESENVTIDRQMRLLESLLREQQLEQFQVDDIARLTVQRLVESLETNVTDELAVRRQRRRELEALAKPLEPGALARPPGPGTSGDDDPLAEEPPAEEGS